MKGLYDSENLWLRNLQEVIKDIGHTLYNQLDLYQKHWKEYNCILKINYPAKLIELSTLSNDELVEQIKLLIEELNNQRKFVELKMKNMEIISIFQIKQS